MLIKCKMMQCPYYDNREFCSKPGVVGIDESGMCSVIWRKGQPRTVQMPFSDENYPKEKVTVIDVAENEINDITIEKEEKEEAEPDKEIS